VIRTYKAFTLIEILVVIFIGTIILLSISNLLNNFYFNQYKKEKLFNLQKQSHQIINYLQQNIQHLAYQGDYREQSNVELFSDNDQHYFLNKRCFVFFYDLNGDGCIGNRNKTKSCKLHKSNKTKEISKEFFGFKFENNMIYVFENKSIDNCVGEYCQEYLSNCQTGKWRKMSDLADYTVENLTFSWKNEGSLLHIHLITSTAKDKKLTYELNSYVYILNGKEK
ncbi:prepilin-type N-terminal cleavage/methylation domain-containing protein, partial [Ursidibacter maritimus]